MKNDKYPLFLDLDGPILDNRQKYVDLHCRLVRDAGAAPMEPEEYWSLKRAQVPETEILKQCGVPEARWNEYLCRRLADIEDERSLALDAVWPGVREWLDFQRATRALYLVTLRKRRSTLLTQLARFDLLSFFDAVLSEDANDGSAAVKARLMTPYLESVEHAVLIGDTEADVRAAKQTSAASIAVTCGIRNQRLLEAEEPDAICNWLVDVDLEKHATRKCEVLS